MTVRRLSILLLTIIFFVTAKASPWSEVQIPSPIGPTTFGESVAISRDGKTALIAAPLEHCSTTVRFCGAVYVYARDRLTWRMQARLAPSDAEDGREFGGDDFDDHTLDLSADGNTAVIGVNPGSYGFPLSPFVDTPKGAVYVFLRQGDTWSEQQKLVRPDASETGIDGFGRSVAISNDGNTIVIGDAASLFSLRAGTGSAYVFSRIAGQWSLQTRLTDVANQSPQFGHAVDISGNGDTIAIGAPKQAFIFTKQANRWHNQAILKSPSSLVDSQSESEPAFCQALALSESGNTAIVNKYIFQRNTHQESWREEAVLGTSFGDQYKFGFSVDIDASGRHAVIGDWKLGAVFLFHRESDPFGEAVRWLPERILEKAGGVGSSVSISGNGDSVLIGYGVYVLSKPMQSNVD